AVSRRALSTGRAAFPALATGAYVFWRRTQQSTRRRLAHRRVFRKLGGQPPSPAPVCSSRLDVARRRARPVHVLDHYCHGTRYRARPADTTVLLLGAS